MSPESARRLLSHRGSDALAVAAMRGQRRARGVGRNFEPSRCRSDEVGPGRDDPRESEMVAQPPGPGLTGVCVRCKVRLPAPAVPIGFLEVEMSSQMNGLLAAHTRRGSVLGLAFPSERLPAQTRAQQPRGRWDAGVGAPGARAPASARRRWPGPEIGSETVCTRQEMQPSVSGVHM